MFRPFWIIESEAVYRWSVFDNFHDRVITILVNEGYLVEIGMDLNVIINKTEVLARTLAVVPSLSREHMQVTQDKLSIRFDDRLMLEDESISNIRKNCEKSDAKWVS